MEAEKSVLQQSQPSEISYNAASKEHHLVRSTSLPYINRPARFTQDEKSSVFQSTQNSTEAMSHAHQKARSFGVDLTNTNNNSASSSSIAVKPAAPKQPTRKPDGCESNNSAASVDDTVKNSTKKSEGSSGSTEQRDFGGYVPRSRALTRAPQNSGRSASMPPPASPRALGGRKIVNNSSSVTSDPVIPPSDEAVLSNNDAEVPDTTAKLSSAASSHRPRRPAAPQQAPPNPVVASARAEVAAAAIKEGSSSSFRPRPPPRAGITRGRSCGPQVRLSSLGEATTRREQHGEGTTNECTENDENMDASESNRTNQPGSFASPKQQRQQKHHHGDYTKARRRSRSTSSTNPSAAAFASPQPFARRHNPFAAPSFCAQQESNGSSGVNGGSGGGGEGLFADGADFSDLLADLDAIEQVTLMPYKSFLDYSFTVMFPW